MYNNFRDVLYNTDIDVVYAVTHTYVYYTLGNIVTLPPLLRLKSNLNLIGWNFKSNLSSNFHL